MSEEPTNEKETKMKIELKYQGGINVQLDNLIRHLAATNRGKFLGSGCAVQTGERDLSFEFEDEIAAKNFERQTTVVDNMPTEPIEVNIPDDLQNL